MSQGSDPQLRFARTGRTLLGASQPYRYFVGLHCDLAGQTIHGALVRMWGAGLHAVPDMVAAARLTTPRIHAALRAAVGDAPDRSAVRRRPAAELAELAAEVISPLAARLAVDTSPLRAVGVLDFGHWDSDQLGNGDYQPCLDTALLAKLSGLTVVDDFPSRDLAHGGRGGPCEAVGAWLMLADRGIVPGRVIRAMVDLSETGRVFLLPPRQAGQLPDQLSGYDVVPAISLLDGLLRLLTDGQFGFDPREQLAIQGRSIPALTAAWDACLPAGRYDWTPAGIAVAPLLDVVHSWPGRLTDQVPDVLCTAIRWITVRIARLIQSQLPRSQPVGQLVLAGPGRQHAFLVRQLKEQLPEITISPIDDHGVPSDEWIATAAALLAMLTVDQVPANTYALTGVETPRVLGRITPGPPGNWHCVLADMARTLPEKMTLRSAV
jgi:anhydro-N-acetylmuramic acid kinase